MNDEVGIDYTRLIVEGVELKSCCCSKQSYKKHLHQELSIGLIKEGTTTVEFGDINYTFSKGEGIIIPPLKSHMCSPEDIEHWRFDMLYIKPEYYRDKLQLKEVIKLTGETVDKVEAFFSIIKYEKDPIMIEEQLIELLIFLEEKTQGDRRLASSSNDLLSQKVKQYIESHYTEKLNLEKLESLCGVNKFTLIRGFKKFFNTTPMAYQLQLKVAKAKTYLGEGMDVFEICHKLGFYDQAHLIREFQKMNGITPQVYVKQMSRENTIR